MLSKYVFDTIKDGQPVLFNIVTQVALPTGSSEDDLSANFFLDGQEHDAIKKKLFSVPKRCNITVIPTWECNLRCTHCVVLDKLVKRDANWYNPQRIIAFIQRFQQFYQFEEVVVSFVGGEPLLHLDRLNAIMDADFSVKQSFTVTTNLATEIDEECLQTLKRIDVITVSLDGDHQEHNTQRKSFDDSDPFLTTMGNIKILMKAGLQKQIHVQSALRDEFLNPEHKKRYFKNLMKLGVLPQQIKFGCIHPTGNQGPTEGFKHLLSSGKIFNSICCKHRMQSIIIDKNQIFTDYYSWSKIAEIDDEISVLNENRMAQAWDTLPVLKDEKCLACPVIGACWGGCSSGLDLYQQPSSYCNQSLLIEKVKKTALAGELLEAYGV